MIAQSRETLRSGENFHRIFKKMKKILTIILVLFLNSCKKKEEFIYYSYEDITVTRVDRENHIYFYYGKFENTDLLPKSYIEATYNGFDGVMDAFLIIEKDKTVKIVPIADLFDEINKDQKLKLERFEHNIDFIKWVESIDKKYKNVYRLSNLLKLEIKRNKENNSEIKAVYPENIE